MRHLHTPGPWTVARDGVTITTTFNAVHVAKVMTQGMGHAVEPNARLIAAAPELLAHMTWLVEAYTAHQNDRTTLNRDDLSMALRAARQIMAEHE